MEFTLSGLAACFACSDYHRQQATLIFARSRSNGTGREPITPSFYYLGLRRTSMTQSFAGRGESRGDKPEPDIVVTVVRVVPVAPRDARIVLIVVP
jgi:hypothetical protein